MEAGGTTFAPPLCLASQSQKEACTLPLAPEFGAAAWGTRLAHLALVASGAYTRASHRAVTKGERVLKWLPRQRPQPEAMV